MSPTCPPESGISWAIRCSEFVSNVLYGNKPGLLYYLAIFTEIIQVALSLTLCGRKVRAMQSSALPNGKDSPVADTESATENRLPRVAGKR